MAVERKKLLLRLDPAVYDALARWAGEELRSTNAQIEFVLRRALSEVGRLPSGVSRMRRPGRPARTESDTETETETETEATDDAGGPVAPEHPDQAERTGESPQEEETP